MAWLIDGKQREFNLERECKHCYKQFVAKYACYKYCSTTCKLQHKKDLQLSKYKDISCIICSTVFRQANSQNIYCSPKCRNKNTNDKTALRVGRNGSTYYEAKDRTLEKHMFSLLNHENRKALSLDYMITLYHKQQGLCALSGVEMTYDRGVGAVQTNMSIDRIVSGSKGGKYEEGNVRLVCYFVNVMRNKYDDEDLFFWCNKIVERNLIDVKRYA